MQNNSLVIHTGGDIVTKGKNYRFTTPTGALVVLERGRDFGTPKIRNKDGSERPALKRPILYKAGAEKLLIDYGVRAVYDIISQTEDYSAGSAFFSYTFRCRLIKYIPELDRDMTIAEGYGSANTAEKNTGAASSYDAANTKLKIAKKRSMVDAVLSMTGLSGCFDQDMENEGFMEKAADIMLKDDDPITRAQITRIFAICTEQGLSREQAKNRLKALGFASTKEITQKDYDSVCDALLKGE